MLIYYEEKKKYVYNTKSLENFDCIELHQTQKCSTVSENYNWQHKYCTQKNMLALSKLIFELWNNNHNVAKKYYI